MRLRQRKFTELQDDEHFPFYVGRLLGAAEMTSHWMTLQAGADIQEMGQKLGMVASWFYTDAPDPDDKAVTKVLPAKAGQ